MEFALAAVSSLTSSVTGALGLGAASAPLNLLTGTAAAGAGAGAAGGSTALSILQGGMGLLGAMASIRAGQSAAAGYRSQAADTRLDVGQETIAATQKETSLRKALVASLGERDVAYAASGVDLSFGTPAAARSQAIDDTNSAMSMARTQSEMRRRQLLARADTLDAMAEDAASSGLIKGLGTFGGSMFDIVKRG